MKKPIIEIYKLSADDIIATSGPDMILSGVYDAVAGDIKFNGDRGNARNSEEFYNIYGTYYFFDDSTCTSTRGTELVSFDGTYSAAFISYNGEYYWDPERLLPWYLGYGAYVHKKETK